MSPPSPSSPAAPITPEQKLVVSVGDLAVTNGATTTLTTYSLGTSLGVVIFDPITRVGGMLHTMLPDSSLDPAKAASQPAMFIDTGVPALFRAAYHLKAEKYRVQIFVVGGAQVMDSSGCFNIGKRNFETLNKLLQRHGLSIKVSHVGGMLSRTVTFNLRTGELSVKIGGKQEELILWKG